MNAVTSNMPVLFAVALALLAIAGVWVGYKFRSNQVKRDLSELRFYRENYLHKIGATSLVPGVSSYHMMSLDGGKHWYNITETTISFKQLPDGTFTRDYTLTVDSPADPNLLAHLNAMDELCKRASNGRPITLAGPDAAEERRLLENAGFTVVAKAQ